MSYTPTLETIRAKMRRTNAALIERAQTASALFAADEMAVALVALTAAEGRIAHLEREQAEDCAAISWLKNRCRSYQEAIVILTECDHGDERMCGCRDKAAAITAKLLKERHEHAAAIARAQEGKG